MKKILFLIISFLFYLTSALADTTSIQLTSKEQKWLDKNPIITLGSDSSWAPYILVDESGFISGYDKDLLDLVNKKMGTSFQLQVDSYKLMDCSYCL